MSWFTYEDWRERAECRDMDTAIFYHDEPWGAKAICGSCPVREECLADALRRREPWGVWGGLDPEERRRLRRARAAA